MSRTSNISSIPAENRDFFLLLRAGLWQRIEKPLSDSPDWAYIYKLACDQTVQGIVADGIGIYRTAYPELRVDAKVYDEFIDQSAQIIRQNYKVNQVQAKICNLLNFLEPLNRPSGLAPINYVILKGQGVAQSYPKPLLRCSGDIDIFFTPEHYKLAKNILKPLSASVEDKPLSLECALVIDGVDVELHGTMESGISDACLRHFNKLKQNVFCESIISHPKGDTEGFPVPSANFNALYILIHTIRHLGSFGISLRQVVDWTMHMHANTDGIDRQRLQSDLQAMHLERLWNLFSTFAVRYLGAPAEDFAPFEPLSPSTLSSLWTIIRSYGSFGKKNPYFAHLHAGRLNERTARIYYHIRQALAMREFDPEFSRFLFRKELRDIFKAPLRFLLGEKTKIIE